MKKIFTKALQNLVILLSRLLRKLDKGNVGSIFSLVPQVLKNKEDIKKIKPYLDLLDKGLEDPTITNIAVSGQYGSGKSTVLRTYQHYYPKFKFLNISLAAFNRKNKEKISDNLRDKIELSILQQIFYHEKPQNLPKSRFNRIINPSYYGKYLYPILIIIWLIGIYVVYNNLNKLNPYNWDLNLSLDWVFVVVALISGLGLIGLIKNLFITLQGVRFSKLNYKGFEFGDDVQRSIFNRHFDEILYFFQKTKYEVVIIEDLDRFYSSEIFAKLREINITLNQSKQLRIPINFVYALKDEVLKDKTERVKFFDIIIPVIPFINSSNAGEQFKRMLEKLNLKGRLSEGLIDDVIIFIDDIDMRLLKNIIIEYQTYSNVLPDAINQDNLFSMIVYKNLKPDDFGKLSRKEGQLYNLLTNKEEYIHTYISEINQQLNSLLDSLDKSKSERLNDLSDLRRIYVGRLFEKSADTVWINIGNSSYDFIELIKEDNFTKLREAKSINLEYLENSYQAPRLKRIDIDFLTLEKEISEEFSYEDRKKFIEDKSEEKTAEMKLETIKLQQKRDLVKNWSLVEIFQEIDLDKYLKEFNDIQVVRSLIINGYINEDYSDYISQFHEVSISNEDNKFLQAVKLRKNLPFSHKLDRVENLTKKIEINLFNRGQILNFQLIDFLLQNKEKYSDRFDLVLTLLTESKPRSEEFIIKFLCRQINVKEFISEIARVKNDLWEFISESDRITDIAKDIILNETIDSLSLEEVEELNLNDSISRYISKFEDYQRLNSLLPNKEVMVELFQILNINLHKLAKPAKDYFELFYLIYKASFYDLNLVNIEIIIDEINENEINVDYNTSLYSSIYFSSCQELIERINISPNAFVEAILLKKAKSTNEDEKAIYQLLNNEELKIDLKSKLIDWLEYKLLFSSRILKKSTISVLFKKNKIKADWGNIIDYLDREKEEEIELDEALTTFLNIDENYSNLGKERIDTSLKEEEADENLYKQLSKAIIYNQNLSLNSYQQLIKAIPYSYNSIDFALINTDKSKALIKSKKVELTNQNLDSLEEHNEALKIILFESRQSSIASSLDDLNITDSDYRNIIMSNEIDVNIRYEVIKSIDETIILNEKAILSEACLILALNEKASFSNDFLIDVIKSSNNWENKITVINKYFDQFEKEEVIISVRNLGASYKEVFQLRKRPVFENNELNGQLFNKLEALNLISSTQVVHKKDQIRVNANHK